MSKLQYPSFKSIFKCSTSNVQPPNSKLQFPCSNVRAPMTVLQCPNSNVRATSFKLWAERCGFPTRCCITHHCSAQQFRVGSTFRTDWVGRWVVTHSLVDSDFNGHCSAVCINQYFFWLPLYQTLENEHYFDSPPRLPQQFSRSV